MAVTTYFDGKPPVAMVPHRVAVLAFDDVVINDFATPCELFGLVRSTDGLPAYDVQLCAATKRVRSRHCQIEVSHDLDFLDMADTVVIPGRSTLDGAVPEVVGAAVLEAAARGVRVVSICTGAFSIAALGLLDGCRATTHWAAAAELARRHPAIEVDANVLYVDAGAVLSSAGASAGIDLCLHMIRNDFGAAMAAHCARLSVVPLERAGGQAQYIEPKVSAASAGSLQPLLEWAERHLHEPLDVIQLAEHASTTPRTLHRRFAEQIGITPMQWVLERRTRAAQRLLETTSWSIERVAAEVGFGTGSTLRERFRRTVGVGPLAYRRAFQTPHE